YTGLTIRIRRCSRINDVRGLYIKAFMEFFLGIRIGRSKAMFPCPVGQIGMGEIKYPCGKHLLFRRAFKTAWYDILFRDLLQLLVKHTKSQRSMAHMLRIAIREYRYLIGKLNGI